MAPSPLRVLFSITTAGVGGAERVLDRLIRGLDRTRVLPVGVAALRGGGAMEEVWKEAGVPVFRLGMGALPGPWVARRFARLAQDLRPHLVHAFLFKSMQAARLARFFGGRFSLLVSPRTNLREYPAPVFWLDRLLRRPDETCVCESAASRLTLLERGGYPEEKVLVIPNGVDLRRFRPDPEARRRLRREWGVTDQTLVVGALGRLSRVKGNDVLVRAFARLAGSRNNCRLVIAGEGEDRPFVEKTIRETGLQDRVRLLGHRSDAAAVLSAYDVYALPSRREGMPNALLEAMAVGLPAAASRVDGVLELSSSLWVDCLAAPGDPEALAAALARLLDDPQERERQARENQARAREFGLEKMVQRYQELYESCGGKLEGL